MREELEKTLKLGGQLAFQKKNDPVLAGILKRKEELEKLNKQLNSENDNLLEENKALSKTVEGDKNYNEMIERHRVNERV